MKYSMLEGMGEMDQYGVRCDLFYTTVYLKGRSYVSRFNMGTLIIGKWLFVCRVF